MSCVSKIGEGEIHRPTQSLNAEALMTRLPFELHKRILFFVDMLGIQLASQVNKLWNKAAIDSVKYRESSSIKTFAYFLREKISKGLSPEQAQRLVAVIEDKKVLESTTLKQIKYSILELKEKILNVLQNLHEQDLKVLDKNGKIQILKSGNESLPLFFERIFDVARIYKKIIEIDGEPDEMMRGNALSQNSRTLAKMGSIEKAIQVACTIRCGDLKEFTLSEIAKESIISGSTAKAFEIAALFDPFSRDGILRDIAKGMAKQGAVDKARDVACTIDDETTKKRALADIDCALAKRQKH